MKKMYFEPQVNIFTTFSEDIITSSPATGTTGGEDLQDDFFVFWNE